MQDEDTYSLVMGRAVHSLTCDAITVVDAATLRFVLVNQAFTRLFGYTQAEAFELDLHQFSAADPAQLDALVTQIARDGVLSPAVRSYRCKDGSVLQLESRVETTVLDGRTLYCAVMRDIRDRQRVERALRESEERFKTLAAAGFEAIALTEEGLIVDGNEQLGVLLGAPTAELIGRRVVDFVAPEWRERLAERFQKYAGEPFEHVVVHVDGTRFEAESQARMLDLGMRKLRVTALRDITKRRKLEQQLQSSQRLESVGRLAGGVAHDFNNLLTVVLSIADLMLAKDRPIEESRELRQIQDAADRAAELTQQLLSFARRRILEPRVVDLDALIASLDGMLRRLLGEHIQLVTLRAPSLGSVRVDPGQIEQIVVNLAINARDAMPDGGTLTIETANVNLGQEYAEAHPEVEPGQYVMVAVSDTGVGMDKETMARVFEPFFTTKAPNRGNGLGLATSYGIVRQCGGSIWVYSEVGAGTTFKVYLPRVHDLPTVTSPRRNFYSKPGTECVILVEDDAMVRQVAARALRAHGYHVLEAATPSAAFELFAQHEGVRAVVTDVVLPEMNGKDMVERLRQHDPDLRVLYTSGYTENTIVQRGVVDDDIDFLAKPYVSGQLAQRLREVLDRPTR